MGRKLKVTSYNIRRSEVDDGINNWKFRKEHALNWLREMSSDIIGFQELMPNALEDLKKGMPTYEIVGCGRTSTLEDEHCAIAVKKDAFTVIAQETFWLSETPHVPGSNFQNGGHWMRICTTATLFDKVTGKRLRVYNTHLDHESIYARVSGIDLIYSHIAEKHKTDPLPVLLMGDFNDIPGSEVMNHVEESFPVDFYDASTLSGLNKDYTFHGYSEKGISKIDFIYATKEFEFEENALGTDCFDGVYLSDHFPVIANFKF